MDLNEFGKSRNVKGYVTITRSNMPIVFNYHDKEYELKGTDMGGLILTRHERGKDTKSIGEILKGKEDQNKKE